MTIMILLAGFVAVAGALGGYVTWRDRRRGGSFVDPSIGRDAMLRSDRRAVEGMLAGGDTSGTVVGRASPENALASMRL
jgi:hypothetical protein